MRQFENGDCVTCGEYHLACKCPHTPAPPQQPSGTAEEKALANVQAHAGEHLERSRGRYDGYLAGHAQGRLDERKSLLDGGWTATVLEEARATISELQAKVKELEKERDKWEKFAEDQEARRFNAELERDSLRSQLAEAQKERDEHLTEIERLRADLLNAKAERDEAQDAAREAKELDRMTYAELTAAREEAARYREAIRNHVEKWTPFFETELALQAALNLTPSLSSEAVKVSGELSEKPAPSVPGKESGNG